MAEVSLDLFSFSLCLSLPLPHLGSALRPYPRVLRGVSELEHVNKHNLNHCIERHTRAPCTGINSLLWGGQLRAGNDLLYFRDKNLSVYAKVAFKT